MNFVHSNPLVCTSVGLTVNRKLVAGRHHCLLVIIIILVAGFCIKLPLLGLFYTIIVIIVIIANIVIMTGVINCPLVDLCYTAVRGSGAFCNGKKLKTSGCNDLSKV